MKRLAIVLVVAALAVPACSLGDDPDAYYQSVSAVNSDYVDAARVAFAEYQSVIVPASDPTFESSFISGTVGFISTMADESNAILAGLQELSPPSGTEVEHARMVDAAELLSNALVAADGQIATLEVAADVNSVISQLPFADLQDEYKDACAAVQQKALADDVTTDLGCDEIGTL